MLSKHGLITWRAPDPELPVRFATFTTHTSEGKGMSVLFASPRDANAVYELLKNGESKYAINPHMICQVKKKEISTKEALCISPVDPRMLHIAVCGKASFMKLQRAIEEVCDFRLPHSLEVQVVGAANTETEVQQNASRLY